LRIRALRKLLNEYACHHEQWKCGSAKIFFGGKDENPSFDRRLEIYLNLPPSGVDAKKVAALLSLLDRLSPEVRLWPAPPRRVTSKGARRKSRSVG